MPVSCKLTSVEDSQLTHSSLPQFLQDVAALWKTSSGSQCINLRILLCNVLLLHALSGLQEFWCVTRLPPPPIQTWTKQGPNSTSPPPNFCSEWPHLCGQHFLLCFFVSNCNPLRSTQGRPAKAWNSVSRMGSDDTSHFWTLTFSWATRQHYARQLFMLLHVRQTPVSSAVNNSFPGTARTRKFVVNLWSNTDVTVVGNWGKPYISKMWSLNVATSSL